MMKDHITLSECSKSDLLWIIQWMKKHSFFKTDIDQALNDLWYEKEKRKLDEAAVIHEQLKALQREYIDIIKPYEGKPITSIPPDVLDACVATEKKIDKLSKKWAVLMGLEV